VVPGSSRNKIEGWLGDDLKVRVSAAPEKGQANAAVEKLLAKVLQLSKGCVQVVAGHTSTRKTVEVSGLSDDDVKRRLAQIVDKASGR
jgi:uncharacterized protein YggU (UPF0235/DUF167 family)